MPERKVRRNVWWWRQPGSARRPSPPSIHCPLKKFCLWCTAVKYCGRPPGHLPMCEVPEASVFSMPTLKILKQRLHWLRLQLSAPEDTSAKNISAEIFLTTSSWMKSTTEPPDSTAELWIISPPGLCSVLPPHRNDWIRKAFLNFSITMYPTKSIWPNQSTEVFSPPSVITGSTIALPTTAL